MKFLLTFNDGYQEVFQAGKIESLETDPSQILLKHITVSQMRRTHHSDTALTGIDDVSERVSSREEPVVKSKPHAGLWYAIDDGWKTHMDSLGLPIGEELYRLDFSGHFYH